MEVPGSPFSGSGCAESSLHHVHSSYCVVENAVRCICKKWSSGHWHPSSAVAARLVVAERAETDTAC